MNFLILLIALPILALGQEDAQLCPPNICDKKTSENGPEPGPEDLAHKQNDDGENNGNKVLEFIGNLGSLALKQDDDVDKSGTESGNTDANNNNPVGNL